MSMLDTLDGIELHKSENFRFSYIKDGKVYTDRLCLSSFDIYFWYCEVDRSVGSYDLEVLKTLAHDVKVIVNPFNFEAALDKYQAHLRLQRAQISVAETVLFDHKNVGRMKGVLEEWGAAVLKPRRGGFGRGVTLIENYSMLRDLVEYIHSTTGNSPDKAYLLEKYYENSIDDWASITIINGEVMYGYRKKLSKLVNMGSNSLKVYDADEVGGEVVKCDITERQHCEALKAYKAMGCEIIGFDFITHKGKPVIVDENTFPGYYEDIFEQSAKDPALEFFKLIQLEIEQFRASQF